ncbi:MAG: hypothetical protein CVU73_12040 [Deltaproteobacteria bacterium HGW-Deltaproteobacteria-8]|jgi:hypothetical protein|nr:MAG: hypothetical protein CVU73_12040 [Deltaproteobacteria bacterium HGW-Deltaproteobacteria-8]
MHITPLCGLPPVLKLIPITRGVIGGDMTTSGGLAAAFDGGISASAVVPGTPGVAYIGKIWPGRTTVRRMRALSNYCFAAASQYTVIEFTLQGSNDTTTILNGTWMNLVQTTFAQTFGTNQALDVTSGIDVSSGYLAHRLKMRTANFDGASTGQLALHIAELELYEYSYI